METDTALRVKNAIRNIWTPLTEMVKPLGLALENIEPTGGVVPSECDGASDIDVTMTLNAGNRSTTQMFMDLQDMFRSPPEGVLTAPRGHTEYSDGTSRIIARIKLSI